MLNRRRCISHMAMRVRRFTRNSWLRSRIRIVVMHYSAMHTIQSRLEAEANHLSRHHVAHDRANQCHELQVRADRGHTHRSRNESTHLRTQQSTKPPSRLACIATAASARRHLPSVLRINSTSRCKNFYNSQPSICVRDLDRERLAEC